MRPSSFSAPALAAVALAALVLVPGSLSAPSAGGAAATDPVAAAVAHLSANAAKHGVRASDVTNAYATSTLRSDGSGATHVNLNQRLGGREVFGGHATVTIARDGSVAFAAGSLVQLRAASAADASVEATEAVVAAAAALDLQPPKDLRVLRELGGPGQDTILSDGGISEAPIPARLGWQPTDAGLRLAWQLVIDDSSDANHWKAVVDARTGELLTVDDWTSHDDVRDLQQTLTRAASPARSFFSAAIRPAFTTPLAVADGSSYRVYGIPFESPNDGERALLGNPADARVSPFGWHDTNAAAGPDFTTTRGNNAHAYLDQDANNQPDFGFDVDGGAGLAFDFAADLAEHAQNYRPAVVANLFYWNNVIHDVLTLYGFDEAADNFQATNYGGTTGNGDYVRAEAADGGGTNNANFNTPAAGGSPRMQMFLWPGNQFGPQNQVVVEGLGEFGSSWARFSPAPTVAGTSGTFVDAGNGCTAASYAGAPAGDWIAIATGNNSGCQNVDKARRASEAGAKALVLSHTTSAAAPVLTGSLTTAAPTIPVASITLADGNAIRAAIATGPTTGTVRKHPSHPGIRDGDFENGIIVHEYGHGVSNRLTGGPGINCLSGNEQAGEGWSDYLAITLLLDPAIDDPQGPRGMGPYALFQDSRQGAGIRPRPYSRNMEIQPFTYDSIKTGGWLNGTSLALPHGLGHGWAAVLWDLDWDLIDKHGFAPNVYVGWDAGGNTRALRYVMDGMKLQGCGPGLVVAGRAVIEAANLLGGGVAGEVKGDACTAWAAFARRGLGYSAVQGTTSRNDNEEAFDTHPDCRRGFLAPVKQAYGQLNDVDAGSTVPLRFQVNALSGPDILATNSPYSRQVDCSTLAVVSQQPPFITPRAYPIPTSPPGNSGLSQSATGVYHYNWKTEEGWAGTCRELVLTRTDGVQHRAFFRVNAPA